METKRCTLCLIWFPVPDIPNTLCPSCRRKSILSVTPAQRQQEQKEKPRREFREAHKTLLIGATIETVPPPQPPDLTTWNDWVQPKKKDLPAVYPAHCPHCHSRTYGFGACPKCHKEPKEARRVERDWKGEE